VTVVICRHPCTLADGGALCSSCEERHRIAHGRRVYFAETARFALIDWNEETRARLAQLAVVDGVYLASTRADFEALRPHERQSLYPRRVESETATAEAVELDTWRRWLLVLLRERME
jgi:hypothetical protein